MWKSRGSVHDPLPVKLKFLYEQERSEQVGMYLRNQNLVDLHSGTNMQSVEIVNGLITISSQS